MTESFVKPNAAASDRLHPGVYKAMGGLALWFVLAAWGFFAHSGYIGLVLTVVSGLVFVTFVIMITIWRIWRKHSDNADGEAGSMRDWLSREFEIRRGQLSGAGAMIEILTPIAAAALGMTAFAIVFHIVA
jgi:hypothetical protein